MTMGEVREEEEWESVNSQNVNITRGKEGRSMLRIFLNSFTKKGKCYPASPAVYVCQLRLPIPVF